MLFLLGLFLTNVFACASLYSQNISLRISHSSKGQWRLGPLFIVNMYVFWYFKKIFILQFDLSLSEGYFTQFQRHTVDKSLFILKCMEQTCKERYR